MDISHLLFVDDEPNVLRSLNRIFINDNFEIELATDGEEALEYLKSNKVDLILSDHNMPGMTGVEFFQKAKDIQPDSIRMLITGRGDLQIALQAINKGHIYQYFDKPWEDDDLRISVIRALEFVQAQQKMRDQENEIERYKSYRQTIVTVSHYINNFNCGLMMSVEGVLGSKELPEKARVFATSALRGAEKISEVLRILNQLQDLKIADYPMSDGMIDIDDEVQKAVERIEKNNA